MCREWLKYKSPCYETQWEKVSKDIIIFLIYYDIENKSLFVCTFYIIYQIVIFTSKQLNLDKIVPRNFFEICTNNLAESANIFQIDIHISTTSAKKYLRITELYFF